MKYVISQCNGEFSVPVPMEQWLFDNADGIDPADALADWLHGKPHICGGGSAPLFVNYLIDLPS